MGTQTVVTVTDPQFGAVGDGAVHLFDPAKAPSGRQWVGTYTPGVDTLDYIGLQEAIYAAFGAPGKEHGVAGSRLNVPLYIPPGKYLINRSLHMTHVAGGQVRGGGRMSTTIVQTTVGEPVLQTNGISYSRVEGIAFAAGSATNFRGRWKPAVAYTAGMTVCARDGSVWRATAAGTSGATEPGWAGAVVTDGAMSWERRPPLALVHIDWDGTYANGWTAACQSNTFADCLFSGENHGVDFGVTVAASGNNAMGSENLFLNCFWSWFTQAGFATFGFNALQNTIVGGNFENCLRYGVWFLRGAGAVYSTGFQNGFTSQIETNGADIAFSNSANDASVVIGCRTESARFLTVYNLHKVAVRGCAIVPGMQTWRPSRAYKVGEVVVGDARLDGVVYVATSAGTSGAAEPAWDSTRASLTDGTATWAPLNYDAIYGANVSLDDCNVLYGRVNLESSPGSNGHVHGCTFSRPDWAQGLHGGSWSLLDNIVTLGGGPNNGRGVVRYAIDAGFQTDAPTHRNVLGLSPDTAVLFPTTTVGRLPLPSVGIVRGDPARDILGVYGAIGRPTPVASDLTTTPADAAGSDLTLVGGLSSGAGAPGTIVLQTADGGPAGTTVNEPVTRLVVSAAGITLGAGSTAIRRHVSTSVAWRPGALKVGATVSVEASLYGASVGDVVQAAFSEPLPAGCLMQAVVTRPGRVRVELFNLAAGPTVTLGAGRVRLESWAHEPLTIPTTVSDDVAQLVADLGVVPAIYDARVGVTVSGSAVSRWEDARGAGHGPALTVHGDGAPKYNPVAGTITGSGTSCLVSEPSREIDLGEPAVVVLVGSVVATWSGDPLVAMSVTNGSRGVAIESTRAGRIQVALDGGGVVTSPVACSPNARVVAIGVPAGGGSVSVAVTGGGAPVNQHVGTAFAGGAYRVSVLGGVTGAYAPNVVRAVVIVRGALTPDGWETLRQWAAAAHLA
jgi:hypothetical protein